MQVRLKDLAELNEVGDLLYKLGGGKREREAAIARLDATTRQSLKKASCAIARIMDTMLTLEDSGSA